MKYIRGDSTSFRSDPIDEGDAGTAITLIHNYGIGYYRTPFHCLVLEGRKGSAVILLETDKDIDLLLHVLQNPPSYQDEPVIVGPYDGAYLVMDAHRGYVKLSMGEVVVFIDDDDLNALGATL